MKNAQAAEVARLEHDLLEVERHAIREAAEAGLVPREALEVLLADLAQRAQGDTHTDATSTSLEPAVAAPSADLPPA